MHELQAFQHLVDDILFVNVLEDICPDHRMQISIHEIKDQVDISVILCPDHVLKADYVFMAGKLLQENYLSECALRISCILKGVKVLLQSDNVLGFLVYGLPNDTISSLAYNSCGYYARFIK